MTFEELKDLYEYLTAEEILERFSVSAFTGDSFGDDLPKNWEEICDYLNNKVVETAIETGELTKETTSDVWEAYWNGEYKDSPEAITEESTYTVFWIGGKRDGETLATFEDEADAVKFARDFSEKHEEEFDPVCGGVGVVDPDGNGVTW